jgi:TolB-like protein/class 3 adenylate cyclase/Flp pilus assembly protein TadD
MSAEIKKEIKLEIAHVLFMDIVGYSKLLINEQRALRETLNQIVRGTEQFRTADSAGTLIKSPTGDGMALIFRGSPEEPVECALEISRALKGQPKLPLRMGVHSGPVSGVVDVNDQTSVAGAGINMAQRVMDCGGAGHILLSKHVAEDLEQYAHWKPHLHDLGECEVKHGVRVSVVNLYTEELGNPEPPERFKNLPGKERTSGTPLGKVTTSRWPLALASILAVALLALGILKVLHRTSLKPTRAFPPSAIPEESIAVLPFENLSRDPDNAYFATGIQDEILTRLAKIGALKVISHTSTLQYTARPGNLPEIARQLAVANILEGSVQKAADQVHINVQLIRAATDEHLWAESYDRKLENIFGVESEVATQIASALRAALSPEERARVENHPTNNVEAYTLYLKAREVETRDTGILSTFQEAQNLYQQAAKFDPDFALAHARLSLVHSWIYWTFESTESHRIDAQVEAEQALRLQPNLGEGHVARATYFSRIERDFDTALQSLNMARKVLPNDPLVFRVSAEIRESQGNWKEAIADLEHAVSVDPRNSDALEQLGNCYLNVKNWAAAERIKKRIAEIIKSPPDAVFNAQMSWAETYWYLTRDLGPAHKILDDVPADFDPGGNVTQYRQWVALLERDFARAESAVLSCKLDTVDILKGPKVTKSFLLGEVALAQGNVAKARPLLETELRFAQSQASENPTSAKRRAQLGLVLAYLGRKEEAIREGRKAVDLLPESEDASEGAEMACKLAEIYARVGEREQALPLIERLLKTPAGLDLRELQADWSWDLLRDDPRFQKMIAGPEPEVLYK